ncbi:MAG: hypothetical protein LBO20_01700 [Bifidobacteriaceae bacterium]|jgi:hypothetical protein|nr:hypothetical protein [Bifidobacteriaceae bacterium]
MKQLQEAANVTEPQDDQALTAVEIEAVSRNHWLVVADEATPEAYPRMTNISAGFLFQRVLRATAPEPPEYVTLPIVDDFRSLVSIAEWNMLWEAAQYRRRVFDESRLAPAVTRIADQGDVNIVIVPRSRSRYFEYEMLFHMLPKATLTRFGLPLMRCGEWPYLASSGDPDCYLPADFEAKLADAWASRIWPHLISGSPQSAFSKDDPIKILAHNLDFWIPAATSVIQQTLGRFPEVDKGVSPSPVTLADGSVLDGAVVANPRKGGDIWRGEDDAAEAIAWTVGEADQSGNLRGIIDAIRSHRVEDDFSERWSFAREDFERKMHRKRSKVKVRFVELTDTIPVQGPETEVLGNIVTASFMAILNDRQREIVVLLNSGFSKLTEMAEILGYANHSPVSKQLAKIRQQAKLYFDLD